MTSVLIIRPSSLGDIVHAMPIVHDLAQARADHIAVTGDLINIALPAEFEHARRWLDALIRRAEAGD